LSVRGPSVGVSTEGVDAIRSYEEFANVRRLIAAGMNDCEIARQTGIPRSSIKDWRRRPPGKMRQPVLDSPCGSAHDFAALPVKAYSYLLGLSLGDGCISKNPRTWLLRITCDTQYPGIIAGCRKAIDTLMPGQRAGVWTRPSGTCADVYLCNNSSSSKPPKTSYAG
jgi:hypothetical protein